MQVPDVLMNGNHKEIELWREEQMVKRTSQRRKDLFKNELSDPRVFHYDESDWIWDI